MVLAYCWAHVRRDFLNAARRWPELAPWLWKWLEDIRTLSRLHTARLVLGQRDAGEIDARNQLNASPCGNV